MPDSTVYPFDPEARGHWIRLRTLVVLRWIAIAGQVAAVAVAQYVFVMGIEAALCYMAIGASVISNLIAIFLFPESKRLSEAEVVSMLIFDISQLCFLLFLTGGLNNPFALLVVAPVTVSASALQLRSTLIVGGVTLVLISIVTIVHVPLVTASGQIMEMPVNFIFGFWLAIAIGLVFIAGYAYKISREVNAMSEALLATQMALAREQKLTDLGGVVAAAAHELGTPLATIKLVSTELIGDLDDPLQREDAELIRDQADRCRDILRSMGRAGKDDKHMQHALIDTVIREAAEPHLMRGKMVHFDVAPVVDGRTQQPVIARRPEIIHGLRNLLQNAVDFARVNVWVDASWTSDRIKVRISDDGEGYPAHVIGRLGDPFLRRRRSDADRASRPEYEGMGLGLFIAKTLLERTGADLEFLNGSDPFLNSDERPLRCGAIVEVSWPRGLIALPEDEPVGPLGENVPFTLPL